jgi:hypothetical protein
MEILDASAQAEDTLVALIDVPVPEINASLSVDRQEYTKFDEEATLILINDGPTRLLFGTPYSIEKKVDGEWRIVPMDVAFNAIGIILHPGEDYRQQVDIRSLKAGEYRIVKQVWAQGLDLSAEMAASFTVK